MALLVSNCNIFFEIAVILCPPFVFFEVLLENRENHDY